MSPHDDQVPTIDLSDPEWAALVADVRDEAPAPRAAFTRELDARVAAGFTRARPAWARRPVRRLLPVVAAVATVGVVVVGASTLHLGSSGSSSSAIVSNGETATMPAAAAAPGGAPEAAAGAETAAPTAAASAPKSAAPSATLAAPAAAGRKVERRTSLELTTGASELQRAADGIVRATQQLGGFVASSQVDRTPAGGQATFVLQLPATRLDEALARFGTLAHVGRMSQGAQDITSAYVSAQRRLTDARQERKALLAALGRAATPRAIATLRARLAQNRAETARLEGDLRGLRRRADLTRVDVTLTARGDVTPRHGGSWGPRDAARDALRVLGVVAGVALIVVAVALPLGLLGGLTAATRRSVRRRRRDGALGAG